MLKLCISILLLLSTLSLVGLRDICKITKAYFWEHLWGLLQRKLAYGTATEGGTIPVLNVGNQHWAGDSKGTKVKEKRSTWKLNSS
jgi:hypothetical protein